MKSKDSSAKVNQRDKIKSDLSIKQLKWTDKQKQFIDLATDKNTRVVFINGPAGTSKSIIATYVSLLLLNEKKISDIIYIRSAVESSDSKIGYLPGDADEKLHYYNLPFLEKLDELLPRVSVDALEKDKRISMHPINYSRGMSWAAKCIILDEAQNSTAKEIITVLTRLGEFSRCFILADPMQTDLPQSKSGGFEKLYSIFNDDESRENGIHTFSFSEEDIVRSKIVKFIVNKLSAANKSV
jgi:phosphate starvation-inducible protein PhoH